MPDPIFHPVTSSTLAEIAYEPNGSILYVRFRDRKSGEAVPGQHYEYEGVPKWIFDDLVGQDVPGSKGRMFDRLVKMGGYSYRKVEE